MVDKNPSLESLPGSSRRDVKPERVTNHTLMPVAGKLPGKPSPPKASSPAPHLLGSGSKIPESFESRMRSQFSSPDPAIFGKKKKQDENLSLEDNPWWRNEVRPSIPCSTYKSDVGPVAATDKSGRPLSREAKHLAEKAERQKMVEQAAIKAQKNKLIGQKEAMLSSICSNPALNSYSPETRRVVNIVMDINKQLGLPPANTGHWKLPE